MACGQPFCDLYGQVSTEKVQGNETEIEMQAEGQKVVCNSDSKNDAKITPEKSGKGKAEIGKKATEKGRDAERTPSFDSIDPSPFRLSSKNDEAVRVTFSTEKKSYR